MVKKNIILLVVGALIILAGIFYGLWLSESGPGKYDDFAKCIKDKGLVFYGAFWCSHCQNQKNMFGSSKQYLPYVECSTPDSNGQLKVCQDQKIEIYPTWTFPDGKSHQGELTLQELAEKSGCQLPQ